MAQIAFIGLGNMGAPMAINLIKSGHQLTVFDLNPDALKTLSDQGATAAEQAKDAVKGADFVISMLPAGQHVESLYLGETGLLDAISTDALIIDSSTIDAETARRVAAAATAQNRAFIDAPVSGGTAGAAQGTLSFMIGGKKPHYERAIPILEAMGSNLFHAGDAGCGQVAKMCNNMLLAINMTGTAEALALAIRNGLSPETVSEIMLKSSGRNWSLEVYNPVPGIMENTPASRDYEGGFMVNLMLKDLKLALDAAASSGASTPMGSLARNLYNLHANQTDNNGLLDFSSIFRLYDKERS
ncbi:MAG: 3-hydroxyisobutyrate dehydrogenase [Oceanospirillales bacterium LUC14_002_19_P2]|nr:MAG: 3-hydroxyisobutyrate dehydrogenase [Oceanospirillales bacterium LUC14_002_19_P2]